MVAEGGEEGSLSSPKLQNTFPIFYFNTSIVFCFYVKTLTPSGCPMSYFYSLCLFTELELLRVSVGKNESFL